MWEFTTVGYRNRVRNTKRNYQKTDASYNNGIKKYKIIMIITVNKHIISKLYSIVVLKMKKIWGK